MENQEEATRVIAATLAVERLNARIERAGPRGASVGNQSEVRRLSEIRDHYDLVIEGFGAWDT